MNLAYISKEDSSSLVAELPGGRMRTSDSTSTTLLRTATTYVPSAASMEITQKCTSSPDVLQIPSFGFAAQLQISMEIRSNLDHPIGINPILEGREIQLITALPDQVVQTGTSPIKLSGPSIHPTFKKGQEWRQRISCNMLLTET